MHPVESERMPMRYNELCEALKRAPRVWTVTGAAGFIGSNLVETLLRLDQTVIGLDNFATGHARNLEEVERLVGPAGWDRFRFIEGDIRKLEDCRAAVHGADFVLHQAALGSVPRSIDDPIASNAANVTGFLNMLVAARDAKVVRLVYAASSSTYGDHPALPKREETIGNPLSPYAVTKYVNELYAGVFARTYDFRTIGLRYFNVFGPRQDPDGPYAAVIPKWTAAALNGEDVWINGDGETSRDFCYVANAVQANILAGTATKPEAADQVYNVACGDRTTLNQLFDHIRGALVSRRPGVSNAVPRYREFRRGDVRHSLADIGKARDLLGYEPTHAVRDGIAESMSWYVADHARRQNAGSGASR